MNALLDEGYFDWLYGLIGPKNNRNPARSHWSLARQLYSTPFIWFVPNDDNRAEDGKELRYEFIDSCGVDDVDHIWLGLECSVLEMLIALARRVAFEANGDTDEWFWKLVDNLGLYKYTDRMHGVKGKQEVTRVLERLMSRRYSPNGKGGLFPLQHPREDQREVELWYQMSSYLLENDNSDSDY